MLQASVSRLASMWNDSKIQVLTSDPDSLRRLCPDAEPFGASGRARWLSLSRPSSRTVVRTIRVWGRICLQPSQRDAVNLFRSAVGAADLVIVTGMGGITDAFPSYARDLLSTVGFARRKRRYVAMVGQGFGPLLDPELVRLAREVLPQISLIALREELTSKPLLLSLGVRTDRIVTTGDDAIEMAYRARAISIGRCLGVNVRVADYSDVTSSILSDLREALKDVSQSLSAETISLPISSVPGEADQESIAAVIATDDIAGADPSPEDVIKKIQKCRLVITGSYHAGVFALASGIPVIGLAKSNYYIAKFEGLSAQFGPGCEVVLLSDPDFGRVLKEKAAALWGAADSVRPLLLKQATRQIEAGRLVYARIKKEVEARWA